VRLGRDGTTLPGTVAACGTCHGADGQGRPEGGVRPPAVVWSELAKPYGHSHPGGRKHPPFTDASLARALRDGVDPAGNVLDLSMPRFAMSDDDVGSLLAYLRRLEEDVDPGIGADTLRVGTVLPTSGVLADVGLPMRAVLSAWFDALNRRGGVNGRKVELVVAGYDGDRTNGVEAARRLLREGRVFALVSGFFPAAEPEVTALVGEERVPLVGPFSLFGPADGAPGAWVFHPSGAVREQARVLAAFAIRELTPSPVRVAVVHAAGAPYAAAAGAAAGEASRRGADAAEVIPLDGTPGRVAGRLRSGGFRAVIVLAGDAELEALARELAGSGAPPSLLAAGTLSGRVATQVAGSYGGRLFLAFPGAPSDETVPAAQELARLREAAGTAGRSRASQASAVVDALVLVEGLKRAGRALSREKLVASLEALHAFETGLAPPVTFGPDRRVGSFGGYVVEVDPAARAFRPFGGWIPLDPLPP
jgi:ABC-type branched-subunit amino acid transport system substrate-binding protein